MRPSERMYEVGMPIWEKCFTHPFVAGIGDGTLAHEKFQYFMVQDHKYLMQYAKVFALGIVKCASEADMRVFSDLVKATLDTENAVHQAYLAELGVTRDMIESTPMGLNNTSYTDYMIAEASKGGMPEIVAAVLACSWSYKVIGDHLETIPGVKEHPFYGRWVEMYTSDGYRSANDQMIDLVDRYCTGLPEEHLRRLEQIVIDCSAYEFQFWDAAWTMGASYTPVVG